MKKLCNFLLFLLILIIFSCDIEIGLGSAVDTEAPGLVINTPPADAVIRDSFNISGTWTDDGTISSIEVKMVSLDTSESKTFYGTVGTTQNGQGTWDVEITPEVSKLADGNYEALVYLRDNGGHTTSMARSFTLDNTPPVLILTKPTSTPAAEGEEEPTLSVYGKTLFLEGSIADTTKETWIEMKFYSQPDCSEESYLTTIETDAIAPTNVNQNNTKYAEFDEDENSILIDNIYSTIYLRENNFERIKKGAVPVYATLTVYDTAETYSSSNNATEFSAIKKYVKGNHTETFYISTDLARDITKPKNSGGKGLAPIDIYKILNGSQEIKDKNRSGNETESLTKEALQSALALNAKTTSVFSVNPDNNPYFTVSGLKTLTGSGTDFATADNGYYIKNGSLTLEISVFMGSDSFELDATDPDFYAYLIECDAFGNPINEDKKENRIQLYSKYKEIGTGKDKKQLYKIGGKEGHKTTNGAYVFSVPVNKTLDTNTENGIIEYDKLTGPKLQYGHNYLIRVSGKDVEGNPIDNGANEYGFRFTSSGAAPEIKITEPDRNYVNRKRGDDFNIQGIIKSEEGEINLSVLMESETDSFSDNIELTPTENVSIYTFEYTIPKNKFSQEDSAEYNITITATGESSAYQYLTVFYDVDEPIITKDKENPLVQVTQSDGSVLNCINGLFTLTGIITDKSDVFGSASYKVIQGGDIRKEGTIPSKFIISVETTNLDDETPVKIVIDAKDRSGNPAQEEFEYFVSQKTDKPVITNGAENVNLDAKEYSDISEPYNEQTKDYYNMFQRKSNLYLSIQDDDGVVQSVTVDLQKFRTNGSSIEPDTDSDGNLNKEPQAVYINRDVIQYPLPDAEGLYFAVVKAYDINFDFTHPDESENNPNFSQKKFYLRITGNGPDVALQPQREFISTKNSSATLVIDFSVTDVGNGPYTVNLDDGTGNKPLFNGESRTSPFTYDGKTYAKGDTSTTPLKFTIKDKNNVATQKTFTPKFDNDEPNIVFASDGYPTKVIHTEDENFFFKGSLNDNEALGTEVSGVESVKIRFITGEFDTPAAALEAADSEGSTVVSSEWITVTSNAKSWNYEANWQSDLLKDVFALENTKTVVVEAADGAGNTALDSKQFVYDKMTPEVIEVTGADYINGNTAKINIKYRDTNPADVEIKIFDLLEHIPDSDNSVEISTEELSSEFDSETGKTIKTVKATVPFPKTKRTGENGSVTNLLEDGTYKLQIIAKDENNKSSKAYEYQLTRDTKDPELENISISTDSTKNRVYNPSVYNYFINNKGQKFTIAGVSKDNVGVKDINLEIIAINMNDTEDETLKYNPAKVTSQIWSFDTIDLSSSAWCSKKGAKAVITVTDKAGNQKSENLNIIFDITGPEGKHEIDAKGKDLYFRIGSSNNDDITSATASKYGLVWNNGSSTNKIDEDVGGKYSVGTYGKDLTIQIRGKFDDASGSGVKTIYYQVSDNETLYSEGMDLNALAEQIKNDTENTKSFAPLENPEIKRVFYNAIEGKDAQNNPTYDGTVGGTISGGAHLIQQAVAATATTPAVPAKPTSKFYKDIETNYKNSLTGFSEGKNFIILVAEDFVGNLAIDIARDVPYKDDNGDTQTGTFINYSLNVDTDVPEVISDNEDIIYTNKKGYIELSGSANDDKAGLYSLKFYLEKNPLDVYSEDDSIPEDLTTITKSIVTIENTEEGTDSEQRKNNWNIKIPASKFTDSGKSYTVYVAAKDNAGTGNETKPSVGTVKVDIDAPIVKITSPALGEVNKEIKFEGSVSDGNGSGIKTSNPPRLYWTTKEPEKEADGKYKELKSITQATLAKDGWVEITVASEKKSWDTSSYDWSFIIDTESLKADGSKVVTDGTPVFFTVCATDNSGTGNTGYAPVHRLIVDQNSDRPVIKFANVNLETTSDGNSIPMDSEHPVWIKKQEIWGSVSDDDGEVQSVEISFDYGTEGENAIWESHYTTQEGLNYSFPSDGTQDGTQTIYFRVIDAKGKQFISSDASSADTNAPILAYQAIKYGTEAGKYSTILYANVDLNEPSIPVMYYSEQDFDSVTTAAALDELFDQQNKLLVADTSKWHDISNISGALGGSIKQIFILIKAKDANGIKEVETRFDENELTPVVISKNNTENTMAALYKLDISTLGLTEVVKKKLEIKAEDNASHNHGNTFSIEIDNVPPEINIDSPSANAEIYGTAGVAQTNVTVRGRTSDSSNVSKVYLAVTTGEDVEPSESGVSSYKDITKRSALSWTAVFNGALNTSEDVYYTDLFNTYVESLYGEGTTSSETQKDICLWIYAVDTLGNSGKTNPTKLPLTILTQGDKPIVAITYPAKTSKVGGVITITGSTSIATNEVDKIFIQIDPDYNKNSNTFSNNWKSSLESLISTAESSGKTIDYQITEIKNAANTSIGYGILASGSKQSWNVVINTASEFNKADKTNRIIGVRACAVSKSNKLSEPVTTWFELDPESPVFGNHEPITLVQYENNTEGTGDIIASKLYTPGMWLTGKWWLTGSIEDESGIDFVKLNGTALSANYLKEKTKTPDNYDGYELKIPVGVAEGQTVYGPTFELLAKEKSGDKNNSLTINLSFDNTPPEFECTSLKTSSELEQNETNSIVQSNGVYEIKGTFKEPGENNSGFKRIMFYVTRTLNSTFYVTDIMKQQGLGIDNCKTDLTLDEGLYWKSATDCIAKNKNEIVIALDKLPDFTRKGGICRINKVLYRIESVADGTGEDTGKKVVTIDSQIDDGTGLTVDFALAQVIDNKVKEFGKTKHIDDAENVIENDDGDKMVESYTETSTEWVVAINSQNIKDGVIKIHFVAYDQAGNKTVKTYDASVANNAPRIAGVQFGTDINGDNEVDDEELRKGYSGIYAVDGLHHLSGISVNGRNVNGEKISRLALPNDDTDIGEIAADKLPVMTVKGKIRVVPEIVGGNNGLSWTYSVDGTNKSNISKVKNKEENVLISGENAHYGDDSIRPNNTTSISIDTLSLLKDISTDGNKILCFTIWDHTEGSTIGINSNYAEVLLKVRIAIHDEEKPTAGIKPFYWDSIPIGDKNNSSIVYENGIALGHIELEKDLLEKNFKFDGITDEEFDLDPKVSGVIYLEGFAKDNVAIEKLYIKFPGLPGFNDDFGLVAKRDRTEGSQTAGKIISVPKFEEKGIQLVSATEELLIDGDKEYNLVHWKLKIDTSKIVTSAAKNILVQIKAEDRGKAMLINDGEEYEYQDAKQSSVPESFDLSKDQTGYKLGSDGRVEMDENNRPTYDITNQTSSYRIDVVPYIAKVYTSLASLKKNNWSVYNRTALGHYPVASNETIYLYGFNLGRDKEGEEENILYPPKFDEIALDPPEDGARSNVNYSSGSDYSAYKVVKFPVTNVPKSGLISLKVNGVETLNNKNNDEGRGSYTGSVDLEINPTGDKTIYTTYYYNRQPNGDNNNLLTDDVELDVWGINSEAVVPISGVTSQPVMSINPVNHDVGFAFVNGALYYSMPNGSTYSYDNFIGGFDYWTSVTMAYDSLGNSYGTAAGGDINETKADQFRIMTSRWGYADRDAGGYNRATNNLRLELIGQYDYMKNGDTYEGFRNFDKERIKSPSLATGAATADSTNVYLAYYDAINDEIRFKLGKIKTTKAATWDSLDNAAKSASFFGDYYGPNTDKTGDSEAKDKVLADDKAYSKYRTVHNSLLAGQTSRVTNTSGNTVNTKVITTGGAPVYAGQYVSIAAIPGGGTAGDDAVVAVWWDAKNNQLLYSYNLTPNSITVGKYKQADTKWSTPVPIFDSNIGEYCKLAVIKEGSEDNTHYSVHIVGYDGLNCDVWYAYLPNFNSTANKKTCLVDSYGLIGTELNIDVALDVSRNPIPYISYYAGSCAHPKTAHWAGTTSISEATLRDSVKDNECFTGVWEVSVVPTQSRVSIDHVNIGLWKDSNGTITWSTTDGEAPGDGNIGETKLDYKEVFKSEDMGYSKGNTGYKTGGHVWGNGSKNPILGYSITKGAGGFIETAQMK